MNGLVTRQTIADSLASFATKPLAEAASEFFAALGYHSERRMEFPSLAAFFSEFDRDGKLTLAEDKLPIAFLVKTRTSGLTLDIVLLRLADHSLAPTVARHLLRSLIESASRSAPLLRVTDAQLGDETRLALAELGFVLSPQGWWKVSVNQHATVEALKKVVGGFALPADVFATVSAGLDSYLGAPSALGAAQIEKVLWPAKIMNAPLDAFLVPIQAQWAQHFFDSDLGSEMLFGLKDELHLGIEGAYYCSKRNTLLQHPGRVLWYVSKGPEGRGSMTVKACSRIEEVFVGKPKDVFKRFSRLGVYQWRDVLNAAEGNINDSLLAFRFSMTERFPTPISLVALEQIGVTPPIMSPRKVTPEQFAEIYRLGKMT